MTQGWENYAQFSFGWTNHKQLTKYKRVTCPLNPAMQELKNIQLSGLVSQFLWGYEHTAREHLVYSSDLSALSNHQGQLRVVTTASRYPGSLSQDLSTLHGPLWFLEAMSGSKHSWRTGHKPLHHNKPVMKRTGHWHEFQSRRTLKISLYEHLWASFQPRIPNAFCVVFQHRVQQGEIGLASAINLNPAEQEVIANTVIACFIRRNHFVLLFTREEE